MTVLDSSMAGLALEGQVLVLIRVLLPVGMASW